MTVDGTDPDWDDRSRDELRRDIAGGVAELAEAEATLANARHVAATDASALERTSAGAVTAPPGSLIWSAIVGAGTAVNIGSPIGLSASTSSTCCAPACAYERGARASRRPYGTPPGHA